MQVPAEPAAADVDPASTALPSDNADSDHASVPSDATVPNGSYAHNSSLHGLPLLDAPLPTYGSGMVPFAYGNLPYAPSPADAVLHRQQSDRRYCFTEQDILQAAHLQGNGMKLKLQEYIV